MRAKGDYESTLSRDPSRCEQRHELTDDEWFDAEIAAEEAARAAAEALALSVKKPPAPSIRTINTEAKTA